MGKKKHKGIIYLKNEQEILDWAKRNASRISPTTRMLYYEATEPRDVVKLAHELGIGEEKAYLKTANILARALINNMFIVEEDIDEADFIQHMEGFYIPRSKELHIQTNDWFKFRMTSGAPDLVAELNRAETNWGMTEYVGNEGTKAKFVVFNKYGVSLGLIYFDPSKNTFEFFGA